ADNSVELRRDGDVATARRNAAQLLEARYELPFLAHATPEPPSALLDLRSDGALLIASLEDPDAASRRIADATGLPRRAIDIRLPRSGGSFGRRLKHDFIAEAIQVALVIKKPVKLFWTRGDDLRNDWYRPFGVHHMLASIDRKKNITSWVHRCAATSRGWRDPAWNDRPLWAGVLSQDSFPAGLIENFERSFVPLESGLPRGDHRGREQTFTAFAEQCFLDELASATERDAVQMRLEMLGEPRQLPYRGAPPFDTGRMAEVLRRCAEHIGWGKGRNDGHGLGIACHFVHGAYVAHAFDVAIARAELVVHRVVCVADVGRVLNPLNVDGLLAGATTDAIGVALNAAITLRDGKIQQKDFSNYNVNPGAQTPRELIIERVDSSEPPVPVYSAATPSTAPALANAIFAASTVRIRKMPMLPELKRLL
ncbi:MAG: molybdopterin cofactor-binding domain-containing protein, partial [Dokdonella sp.]